MTLPATETPLTPLPLTPEQEAIIRSIAPQALVPVQAPEGAPARVVVKPVKDSRLEALLTQYKPLKDDKEAAAKDFEENTIRAELEALYPGDKRPTEAYEIPATNMWPRLTFSYREAKQLATKQVKELMPVFYEAFSTVRSWWELRESAGRR
jgi:hypothetical protein